MSARVLAVMLVLIVIAGSEPARILQRLLETGAALMNVFR